MESIFIMWKTTGDVKWRERGYGIFQAIEKHARTKYGYSTVRGIDSGAVQQLDDMPRYVVYIYLLFLKV
jgi:mannosyl-oligosaccharide alpha-1,2-mannosidase